MLYYRAPKDTKVWQAIRGTSAAPTFFDEFKLGEDTIIDGGLTANNPTEVALEEARCIRKIR